MIRKRLITAAAVLGLGSAVAAGAAIAETVTVGNTIVTADGSFKPTKLPKKKFAPVALKVEGHQETIDGTVPEIADRIVVDFDKNGTVTTKGIATCDPKKLQNTTTAQAKKKCKDALVGTGRTRAIVDFPDQEPFDAVGPLLAFNGKPKGGKPVIVFHVLANVPLPTTFVVPATIQKSPLPGYGKRVDVRVPPIAGGNGRLVDFELSIKRKPATGKKYLLAKCPNGRFRANVEMFLRDGRSLELGLVRKCKGKKK